MVNSISENCSIITAVAVATKKVVNVCVEILFSSSDRAVLTGDRLLAL